jgi:antitoxin MazE
MQAVIQKWGNSLGVRIPSTIAGDLNIKNGSIVELSNHNGELTITPLETKKKLSDMLALINDDNLHEETNSGDTTGREIW